VLTTHNAVDKAILTKQYCKHWKDGDIKQVYDNDDLCFHIPAKPARPISSFSLNTEDELTAAKAIDKDAFLLSPEVRQKAKNLMRKNALEYTLHGICNAELYAIDLFWDLIARYIHATKDFPIEFFNDLIYIAEQEAFHFLAWKNRLEDLGYLFGTFPFQDGLWQSANDTSRKSSSHNLVYLASNLPFSQFIR
jgi:uncharacterized ferritin-like protein (DUF455 family)